MLAYGNVDDNINESLETRRKTHRENTLKIINGSPKELLATDEIVDADEKRRIAQLRSDINATIGHAMGVEYDKVLMSPSRRPFKLASREGKPVTRFFG